MHFSIVLFMMVIRQNYLPLHLSNSKSLHEFFNILSLSDSNVINQVSNFIFHIMKKETVLIYDDYTVCKWR